jgi:branched-chain amino acid transport system permease protein
MGAIENYLIHIAIIMCIYLMLAVSLNFILGFTGLVNLGHIALFGIGAYASALVSIATSSFIFGIIAAAAISSICGLILIFVTKKLQGDYYALATLGFAFVVYSLLLNMSWLTRGALGIAGIQRPDILGITFTANSAYLGLTLIITFGTIYSITKIAHSPFGKLLEAMRDDEVGVAVLGKNTKLLKYKAMAIAGSVAGIAGSVYAHYVRFIEPSGFFINDIILILTIVLIGGIASIKGSIIASIILTLLPEFLRLLPLPNSIVGPARQIVYALLLLIIIRYKPRGIFGRIDLE